MRFALIPLFLFILTIPGTASAWHSPSLTVQILSTDGTERSSFPIATGNEAGGAKVAAGDLGNDGVPEIIIANGLGNEPRVTVYREDGSEVGGFLAYEPTMGTGVTVAVCDPDGDGVNDIITGTQYGGGPQVRTFNNVGEIKEVGFFAYAETFRGGVNLACGDLDDDGEDELVTTPGPSGGPHVRIWKYSNDAWILNQEFFSFAQEERGGVVAAIHKGVLYTTLQRTTGNHVVKSYVIHSPVQESAIVENHTTTTTGMIFVDDKLFTTAEDGGFVANTAVVFTATVPFGSVNAATADFDNDGIEEIIAVADRPFFDESTEAKRIEIDISDQRLYAYENGILANSFLISSGKLPFITPTGMTSVLAKLPYVDYTWSYGPGNPNNYSLGLVPWNLRIFPHIYIHYAYWHNNFGHPMSHGCVNVNLENIQWIYHWSSVGIPVEVRE